MAAHLLRKSAALFADMMAERSARLVCSAEPRSSTEVLADINARLARPAAELPSLIGALAMRGATCGAHRVEVAA